MKTTNEQALEISIEKTLTGYCTEDIKNGIVNEPSETYGKNSGFVVGFPTDFDKQFAIDTKLFWQFLETTQSKELEKLKRQSDYKLKILNRFDRMIKKYGIIHLLKKGLEVDDAHFSLFYQAPLASSSDSVKEKFKQNIFSVTRQLRYSQIQQGQEIDLVIFINGLPIITTELKNHWTGQNAREHGINQYKNQRDNTQPLLQFARCIVHFAVDTDEVYMTTKLNGKKTFFLPFNKGNNNGKGNPVNPNGHKTAYLWEEILTKESLANIIQHFVRLDGTPKDNLNTRTLFFPRYHQLDVVRKIIKDCEEKGVGQKYLIQHSAGSGKSNSITWSAFQLIETYTKNKPDKPLFDSVIVVTDRRLLDKQIRENIKQFSEVKNIVAPAFSSKELRESLEQGKKIIITTIQKFLFIVDGISDLSDKNFAVIIDEAHSSQSGTAHDNMNRAMGQNADEELDAQDKIIAIMQSRKMKGNASYLAFTATPKNTTLEKFGTEQPDGSFLPFHLYSMKQAIEEGFILDVLSNYTTLKSYYKLEKAIADNPLFDTRKAQAKLRAFVEKKEETITTKAEIMLDHFMQNVYNRKRLKGKAKAMVVTQSIESAIKYYQSLQRILDEKGNPFKIIIAFSGEKEVKGISYTEAEMNGFADTKTKEKFDEDEYRILVVANKYLTGFDQPKLCTMYVDKKLQGVLAVQALSRLNRSADKYGKRTEDIFVLDFFNTTEDIKNSFDPFYTSTSLSQATDPNVLHELKEHLGDIGVYEWEEVVDFTTQFLNGVEGKKLSPIIDKCAYRFTDELELTEEEKADFKIKAKQFVKIYGQIASIIPFEMVKWEQLYWFLKFLIPKLPIKDTDGDLIDGLLNAVDLATYGLQRDKLGVKISLDDNETELDPQNPNPRGAYAKDNEKEDLDSIISEFNQRWFSKWESTPEDQRVKIVSLVQSIQNHADFEEKVKQNINKQTQELAFKKILDDVMAQKRKEELDLYRLYAKDEMFLHAFSDTLRRLALK